MELKHVTDQITDRLGTGVGELRDRTADIVAADGGSIYREVAGVRKRVEEAEDTLLDRIDAANASVLGSFDTVIARDRRTTWPRRLFWIAFGVAAGAAAAYFADPDRGRARRAQLSDQAAARSRDVAEQLSTQATMAVNEAKGAVVETVKDQLPETPETDPRLLEQRIKSEVFGHRDDVQDVVLRVDAPGAVALKGTVPSPLTETELLASVAEIDGVIDVTSELSVRSS